MRSRFDDQALLRHVNRRRQPRQSLLDVGKRLTPTNQQQLTGQPVLIRAHPHQPNAGGRPARAARVVVPVLQQLRGFGAETGVHRGGLGRIRVSDVPPPAEAKQQGRGVQRNEEFVLEAQLRRDTYPHACNCRAANEPRGPVDSGSLHDEECHQAHKRGCADSKGDLLDDIPCQPTQQCSEVPGSHHRRQDSPGVQLTAVAVGERTPARRN
jgi:hypothetical protein